MLDLERFWSLKQWLQKVYRLPPRPPDIQIPKIPRILPDLDVDQDYLNMRD